MRKDGDSRRTKKYPQKSWIRNLAKATYENSIGNKESNDFNEMITAISKKQSKRRLLWVLLRFWLVFYGF